jgi:hypothetical protein
MIIHSKYRAKTVQPSRRGARPVAAARESTISAQNTECTISGVGVGRCNRRPTSSG